MIRTSFIQQLSTTTEWDVIVIGGGATGLGIALDASTRGYSVLLLEAKDFAKGTSSRSTKLVHGGVRYLAQGDVALVKEALRERGRLANNAPHLFKKQAFIIPGENFWSAPYYTLGLWVYDKLAGTLRLGKTQFLSKSVTKKRLAGVKDSKIQSGVCYYDGQFDDARLATTLYRTIINHGGVAINYCSVNSLIKDSTGKIAGVQCQEAFTGQTYDLQAKTVINATGVFANDILAMDEPASKPKIVPSQGIHLVLDRKFLLGDDALMVPKTSDGRVLFAVPWHNKLVVGTTDTLVKKESYEPKPREEEIQFILDTAKDYLSLAPTKEDVQSVFVGLRPLAAPEEEGKSTKEVSRSHKIEISKSGLVHIFGGKWTTYRQMAEDTLDAAIRSDLLPAQPCKTAELRLHGYLLPATTLSTTINKSNSNNMTDTQGNVRNSNQESYQTEYDNNVLNLYGTDAELIKKLVQEDSMLNERIHPDYPYIYAQVEWALKHEMAQTIEDILARRIRLLFLDAKAAGEVSAAVANFMASRLGWDDNRIKTEISEFNDLVKLYSLQ